MSSPQNILIRMPNWIGDLVMATPLLTDLRNAFPDASVTAMCRTPLCELLTHDKRIDELFCFTKPSNDFSRRQEKRDLIAKIQAGKYDVGILLTNSFSSAWWFWQGKVKRRIGFRGNWRSALLTDPIPFPKEREKQHLTLTYKCLLEPLGVPRSQTAPRLFVLEKEKEQAKQKLRRLGWSEGKKLIGIHPGATYGSAKCWPPERFHELAKRLSQDPSHCLLFFGDNATSSLVHKICQGLPKSVFNLAGETHLRELLCLIALCDVLVTNDSGPMHIGAAMGTPLVALFGSTSEIATGPYGQPEAVIHKKVDCSPCFKRTCPIDFRCMKQIEVQEVWEKVHQQLTRGRLV